MELEDTPRGHHGADTSSEGRSLDAVGHPLLGSVVTEAEPLPVGFDRQQRPAVHGYGDGARQVPGVGQSPLRDPGHDPSLVEDEDAGTRLVRPGCASVP